MIEIQTPYGCFSVPRATLLCVAKFVVELNNDNVVVVVWGTALKGAPYAYRVEVGVYKSTGKLFMRYKVLSYLNEIKHERYLDCRSTDLTGLDGDDITWLTNQE